VEVSAVPGSGDLLLRLLRLSGWTVERTASNPVTLHAHRGSAAGGNRLNVQAVGSCEAEAVLRLFERALAARDRAQVAA
jgi:hypothetical protein